MTPPPFNPAKLEALRAHIRSLGRVLVAYSGGVDSTLVLRVAAEELELEALGIMAVSPSLPESERQQAVELAEVIGARLKLLPTQETEDELYQANQPNRCFHCKDHVYGALRSWADAHHFDHILDGMNVDDTLDVRPGRAAAKLHEIKSPLHDLGFTKEDIRAAAYHLDLPNWNKPAAACLASRIPYGTPVTHSLLGQVERAEAALTSLGFNELRVRHHGEVARIEVPETEFDHLIQARDKVSTAIKSAGYIYVSLDLQGLRQGSMNEGIRARGEAIRGA
jgi:pyridinium-3,5-biscarboxylic acid mononucleotide sulfurtransferase